jgi:alkylresorcinol/alkylpyrone synthase
MQPCLLALKSAVPPYKIEQPDVAKRAAQLFSNVRDIDRFLPVFANTGIERRYSCVPIDWYNDPHGWADRTALYIENAVALLERVALDLLDEAGLTVNDIDTIVVSSTTGVATPSLDALVVERLQMRRDIQRLPIFGLGCAGGVVGLARASAMAKAQPGSRVLFLVVELCALTFRKNDISKSNIVATALFGDGAAGAILCTEHRGKWRAHVAELARHHGMGCRGRWAEGAFRAKHSDISSE